MRMKKTLAMLAGVALIVTGCSSSGQQQAEPTSESVTVEGGYLLPADGLVNPVGSPEGVADPDATLTVSIWYHPPGFDPTKLTGNGCCGQVELGAVYDTLMRYNRGDGTYSPQLAKDLQVSEDGKVWTLSLREGVMFSDNTPLDANAVVFNIQRHSASRWAPLVALIEEYNVVDEHTVEFVLSSPWSSFPYLLSSMPGMIASPTALETLGEGFATAPVGAGPFILEKWTPNEQILLRPNENYWNGAPNVAALRIVAHPDPLASLKAGDVDVAYFRGPEKIVEGVDAGFSGYIDESQSGNAILFNLCQITECGPDVMTQDIRIRQAIALAVDPMLVDQQVNAGTGVATNSLFSVNSRWTTESSLALDREAAKALVDEVKSESDWDGTIRFSGGESIGVSLQAQLKAIGINVVLDIAETAENQRREREHDFDMMSSSVSMNDAAPYFNLSTRIAGTGASNGVNASIPELDSAIAGLLDAQDDGAVQKQLDLIQTLFDKHIPALPWGPAPEGFLWGNNVAGVKASSTGGVLLDAAYIIAK